MSVLIPVSTFLAKCGRASACASVMDRAASSRFDATGLHGPRSALAPSRRVWAISLLCLMVGAGSHRLSAAGADDFATALGATLFFGSTTASNRLEQIYYLGTFDPDERVPPTFFRVRVRGQASILSRMKFGSGWVPAGITDSLTEPMPGATSPSMLAASPLQRPFGASLLQYGPEGFRTVPDTHRLVVVMGGDPSAFFNMVDGFTASITQKSPASARQKAIKERMDAVDEETKSLDALKKELENSLLKEVKP
jgi:hypothetical protein